LGCPARVAGSAQPRGEALDGAVHDELDGAELQLVAGRRCGSGVHARGATFRVALRRKGRDDAQRIGRVARHFAQRGQALGREIADQVGGRGHARELGHAAELPDRLALLGSGQRQRAADHLLHGVHGGEFLEFARGLALGVLVDAVDIGVLVDAGQRQHGRVHIHQVHAGVQDDDGPRGGDTVQLAHRQPAAAKEDGIEPPGQQRGLRVGQGTLGLGQAGQHGVQRAQAGPQPPVGIAAVKVAQVDRIPHGAFHQVAVGLDQAGHEHLAAQVVDSLGIGPGGHVGLPAHRQHRAVPHGHMGGLWLGRVHGEDGARREDAHALAGFLVHGDASLRRS